MIQKIDLNGEWQFKALNKYGSLPADLQRVTEWMRATVPGTVHTDLMSNNIIPDPFVRMNELDVQWVDSQQWVYQKEFEVDLQLLSERNIELVAEGLDTFARISMNGKNVAQTSNMFVEHRFSVKRFLKEGKNVIEILFDSPVMRSKELEKQHGRLKVALESHRVYVRKAQYSFGWDWGPRLTTSGIWRNISLEAYSDPVLREPQIKTISLSKGQAVVEWSITIEGTSNPPFQVCVTITGGGKDVTETRTIRSKKKNAFRLTIPHPQLWWPNGYGTQPMYLATVSLMQDGKEVHSLQIPFAIRTVRLLQEKDEEGRSFIIEVNGVKIFCKGADWIPCDTFLPRIQDSTYEKLLTMAKQAHMNMIRVWGGGIYEREIFYELCDKLGLMVWQDFMFACGEYPEEPWFLKEVEDEALKAVKRLRHHPSIVLWCGNNECEWNFCKENPGKSADDMKGATIFRDLLPSICRELDGTRPYWRSSPYGKGFPNDESNGTHHQWSVWGEWKDYREYGKNEARFVAEFGFQAPAHRATFEQVTLESDRHPQSRVMEHHNKLPEGTEMLLRFQAAHYRLDTNFANFIYKGQLVQGEALKCAIEHWRRRKFKTAGALFWQLNDCWPVSSWSVVDSSLRPKAAYYYAKRFFAPVLVSFRKGTGAIEVWGTNDTLEPVSGVLAVSLRSFDGATNRLKELNLTLPRNASIKIASLKQTELERADPARSYLLAQLKVGTEILSLNRFFLVEPKHMQLSLPKVNLELKDLGGDKYSLMLRTTIFVKNVCIQVEGEDVGLDENFFDMDAGVPKQIVIGFQGSLKQLKRKLTTTWLNN